MHFEFHLTVPGIKVLKRKEAKGIHKETNAEGYIRAPPWRTQLRAFLCVYQVSQVILLREPRDTMEEGC